MAMRAPDGANKSFLIGVALSTPLSIISSQLKLISMPSTELVYMAYISQCQQNCHREGSNQTSLPSADDSHDLGFWTPLDVLPGQKHMWIFYECMSALFLIFESTNSLSTLTPHIFVVVL